MPRIVSNMPAAPSVYTKRFDKFSGVDFSNDSTKISEAHSPSAKNLISDLGGHPEKRVGWRSLTSVPDKVNGIFALGDIYIVHAGSSMYKWAGDETEPELLMENLNDNKSFGIIFREKLWMLTGEEFLCFDGEELNHVRDIAYVPQVLSNADYELKNGETYQPFNLLTTKRCVGLQMEYYTHLHFYQENIKKIAMFPDVKVYNKESGEELPNNGWNLYDEENSRWILSFTSELGYVEDHPFRVSYPDEVLVEYDIDDEERLNKNRSMIEKCTFAAVYENRLFLGGNPDYPNTDFYSELNDGTYFADVNYTDICVTGESAKKEETENRENNAVGTGGTKIVGYSYVGRYLAIHKDGAGNGASVYLRSSSMTENGMIFPITEGINGEIALSPHSMTQFINDPLFLTKNGIYAIASADITSARSLQSRSTKINARLVYEPNLNEAVTVSFDGYFMVFINGNVYVADATLKTYARNISNAFEYEWYFWDNVPARCVLSHDGNLFFGTEDGRLCRFNTDLTSSRGGYLPEAYSDDGEPISAEWTTPMSDLGAFEVLKQIRRRGSGIYVKNHTGHGKVKLLIRTERDFGEMVGDENKIAGTGLFSFEDIDFSNFSFNTQPHIFIPFGKKIKNFRMVQVVVKNDEVNSAFGVLGVEFRYVKGQFAK